jgi:hypothetical protein
VLTDKEIQQWTIYVERYFRLREWVYAKDFDPFKPLELSKNWNKADKHFKYILRKNLSEDLYEQIMLHLNFTENKHREQINYGSERFRKFKEQVNQTVGMFFYSGQIWSMSLAYNDSYYEVLSEAIDWVDGRCTEYCVADKIRGWNGIARHLAEQSVGLSGLHRLWLLDSQNPDYS